VRVCGVRMQYVRTEIVSDAGKFTRRAKIQFTFEVERNDLEATVAEALRERTVPASNNFLADSKIAESLRQKAHLMLAAAPFAAIIDVENNRRSRHEFMEFLCARQSFDSGLDLRSEIGEGPDHVLDPNASHAGMRDGAGPQHAG